MVPGSGNNRGVSIQLKTTCPELPGRLTRCARFHRSALSRLHLPNLRRGDSLRSERRPRRGDAGRSPRRPRRAAEGRPPAGRGAPARTFMNSSLSKQSVSGPLGRFILLFSIPSAAASQRRDTSEAKKQETAPTDGAAAATASFHLTGGTASANMAAPVPRPMSEGAAGRPPPAAAKRGARTAVSASRRQAVLPPCGGGWHCILAHAPAGLGGDEAEPWGVTRQRGQWDSLPVPPFPLGKIYRSTLLRSSP